MEQSRLKLRISRMFRASFGSCQTLNISDVMEKAVFAPLPQVPTSHRFKFQTIDQTPLMSPKVRPFPSICKPRCPESAQPIVNNSCIRLSKEVLRRRKVCVSDRRAGRPVFAPASPNSPFDEFYDFYSETHKRKSKKKKRRSKSRACRSSSSVKVEAFPFGSASKESYSWWLSSEDDDENENKTLFSSRSLSSAPWFQRNSNRESEMGVKMAAGRVKDSLAVVKRSSDPYSDFRTSMVEMIVEKQIFAAKDLENLLQCFLSLNSHHHHNIIVQVFTEIWEALFCNWC